MIGKAHKLDVALSVASSKLCKCCYWLIQEASIPQSRDPENHPGFTFSVRNLIAPSPTSPSSTIAEYGILHIYASLSSHLLCMYAVHNHDSTSIPPASCDLISAPLHLPSNVVKSVTHVGLATLEISKKSVFDAHISLSRQPMKSRGVSISIISPEATRGKGTAVEAT